MCGHLIPCCFNKYISGYGPIDTTKHPSTKHFTLIQIGTHNSKPPKTHYHLGYYHVHATSQDTYVLLDFGLKFIHKRQIIKRYHSILSFFPNHNPAHQTIYMYIVTIDHWKSQSLTNIQIMISLFHISKHLDENAYFLYYYSWNSWQHSSIICYQTLWPWCTPKLI